MKHETLYTQYEGVINRAQKARPAIPRLENVANRLQRGDYSDFNHFKPNSISARGNVRNYDEVRIRSQRTVRRIRQESLPELRAAVSEADMLYSTAPLRIHLRHLRLQAGLRIVDLSRMTSMSISTIAAFERGRRPSYEPHVNQYLEALKLPQEDREKLLGRVEAERALRNAQFIKNRTRGVENADPSLSFGEQLKFLRENNGLSYKALAKLVGLSPEVIFQIETRGTDRNTYEATLMRFWNSKKFPVPDSMRPQWLLNPRNKGEYLRMLRVKAGVTKREFSKRAKRDESAVKKTETIEEPSGATIEIYEKVLKIKIVFPDFD